MNDPVPPSVAGAPPPRFDFPTWLPAMLVKELRQGLRARGFVGGLIGVQAIMLFVFIGGFAADATGGTWHQLSEGFFWAVTGGVLLAGAPLRALGALGPEIELRTMDLLLLTRLDAWRIVWGKWVSLQAQTLLLLATVTPYAVVRYFFGSVDLVADFGYIAAMLGAGAVLSAIALWASGLPRALRVLVIIVGLIFSMQLAGLGMARMFFGGMAAGGGSWATWPIWLAGAWSGAVVLLYALILAVRWFAPPAENHSGAPRLAPAALALPALLLAAAGKAGQAGAQLGLAAGALAFVAVVELIGLREPMAIHLRGWMARGPKRGLVGLLALPGWPSAAAWLAAMLALSGLAWAVVDLCAAEDLGSARLLWLLALGWAALVFPLLLVTLVPAARKTTGVLYFVVQGLLGGFALIAASTKLRELAPPVMDLFNWVAHALPPTSFWHALAEWKKPGDLPFVPAGQAAGFLLAATLTAWLSRPYWARVRTLREGAAARR